MRLSCLTDPAIDLVADASTLINLNASGQVRAVLAAIPNPLLVTDMVMGELQEDNRSGRRDADILAGLISEGLIRPCEGRRAQGWNFRTAGRRTKRRYAR